MGYSVYRLSNDKDKEDLFRLWEENHENELTGKYEWMYEGNPAGKAVVFMVKEDDTQECIGCFAVFARRLTVNGEELRAGVGGDLLVHKKHRVLIPALKLEEKLISIIQAGEFDLIYGFPNQHADAVMRRVGFQCLGSNMRIAKVIRPSHFLREKHFHPLLKTIASLLADFALKMSAFETWYRFRGGYRCEEVDGFDERFDQLWSKSRPEFSVLGARTAECLTWKCLQKPNGGCKIFTLRSARRHDLHGYIAYCLDDNSLNIKDFVLPNDPKGVRVLLTHFFRHARRASSKSVIIQLFGSQRIVQFFKRYGFVIRKDDWNIYYYANEDVLKQFPDLEDPENWLLTSFDEEN